MTVEQMSVPVEVRALSTLSSIGYEDTFVVDVGRAQDRTAEQWAREILENIPRWVRLRLRLGWSAIGFKLDERDAESSVQGWEIRNRTQDYIVVGVNSYIGMPAELVFLRNDDQLLFATFVQCGSRFAKVLWSTVKPGHLYNAHDVLRRASRVL